MATSNHRRKLPSWLPGDPKNNDLIEKIIRVDHAGEYGAKRIYEGQIKALLHHKVHSVLQHMYEQEHEHLQYFTEQMQQRKVRPTVLQPLWHWCGYALGLVTGYMGTKAAMACTVAVENEIEQHYNQQLTALAKSADEPELSRTIERFRMEEIEHHDIGIKHKAPQSMGYPLLYLLIGRASKAAIWLSTRW